MTGALGYERPDGRRGGWDPAIIVGLIVTLLLHGGLVGAVFYLRRAQAARPEPPQAYVVARLVRLGKPRNPRHLPRRVVPQPAMKKVETVSYDVDADAPPQPRKKPKEDPHAMAGDQLRRSLDRAALLDQAQREIEGEGDPDGVVGGTATEAGAGDAYITRIADLWLRTWSLPAIIPAEEAKRLYALVVIEIDRDGQIRFPIRFDRSSGNDHFDSSIRAAWQRIGQLPLPPPERLASTLANGLALKLTWRGLQ